MKIYNDIREAIIVTDINGIVIQINELFSNMFGYSESEIIGQNINIIIPEPYRSKHNKYIEDSKRSFDIKLSKSYRHVMASTKSGNLIQIEMTLSHVKNNYVYDNKVNKFN